MTLNLKKKKASCTHNVCAILKNKPMHYLVKFLFSSYFSMEGDYLESIQFLYNSFLSPLGTTRILVRL